jgi:hypothetical protein
MGSGLKDNKNTIYELAKSNNGWGTANIILRLIQGI